MNEQMIFKRYEIKYMITKAQRTLIRQEMGKHMIADSHGKSTILSLYFDTPDYLLVRRSIEHPLYKEKLRLRSYGVASSDSPVFVELKKKYDSVVYKRRTGMSEKEAEDYLFQGNAPEDTQIIHEIDFTFNRYPDLKPAILLSYQREAYYAKDDPDFRITFDENILWRDDHLSLCSGVFGTPLLAPDQVLMEVKTAGAIPLWLVRILSENHIYKTTFSKYGTAYTALYQNEYTGGTYHYA